LKGVRLIIGTETLLCVYCDLKEICNISALDIGSSFMLIERVFLVTESERDILAYSFSFVRDEGVSRSGHGELIDKKVIPQQVHDGKGICGENVLLLTASEDGLEAGAIAHQKNCKLMKMVVVVFDNFQKSETVFESFNHDNFLVEVGIFRTFHMKFERVRVFVWLLFVLLMSEAALLVGSGISSGVFHAEGAKAVSGSIVSEVLICIRIECKKGMNFEAVMPISNKYSSSLSSNCNLPTFSSIGFFACSKPPVIKSSPSFTS
jgi:hypothetical protein